MKRKIRLGKSDPKDQVGALLDLEAHLQGKPSKYWHRVDYPEALAAAEVQSIRKTLKQTQLGLASALGMSLSTVRSWEQGTKSPDGLARKVLRMLKRQPKLLEDFAKA